MTSCVLVFNCRRASQAPHYGNMIRASRKFLSDLFAHLGLDFFFNPGALDDAGTGQFIGPGTPQLGFQANALLVQRVSGWENVAHDSTFPAIAAPVPRRTFGPAR